MKQKQEQAAPRERLISLDALRGFDMFWITGGGSLIAALAKFTGAEWMKPIAEQMHHVPWEGFHFEDLIFPLFMFISGIAIPFALVSKIEKGVPQAEVAKKAVMRGLTLVLIGWVYNGLLENLFKEGSFIEHVRFPSVLGQIGLGYMFAALITVYTKSIKSRLYWLGGILLGIGILQLLIPVPGVGAGVLTPEGCINGYIDRMFVPGRLHGKIFDPEGLLCVVSAISVTLMGSFAGYILRDKTTDQMQKVKYLASTGAIAVVVALVLGTFYPIIKACWTDSFNILTSGIGFLLIALFYWIIDVKGWHKWSFYFQVIGMNSIFIYLFERFVDIPDKLFFGWANVFGEDAGRLISVVGMLGIYWGVLYFLYKKKIFFRV